MEFTTIRCLIRPFFESDLTDFIAYRNDMNWMRFQGFKGLNREEYRAALLSVPDESHGVQLAVIHRESGRLIGDLYYRTEGNACWLSYTIAPDFARQGYTTEVTQAFIRRCASRGFGRVLADVSPDNTASLALVHKLGFRYEARTPENDLLFCLSLSVLQEKEKIPY